MKAYRAKHKQNILDGTINIFARFPFKKPYSITFYKKDDATMKRRKRRLNPIYWVFQFLGGLVAIGSLFWIPYLVEKIVN